MSTPHYRTFQNEHRDSKEFQVLKTRIAQLEQRISKLEKRNLQLRNLFSKKNGFLFSIFFTLILAALIIFQFDGQKEYFYLYYMLPIGVPFINFLFERIDNFISKNGMLSLTYLIDAIVVVLGLIRAIYSIPFISGHALFLGYSLITTQRKTTRWTTILILLQVCYLKIFAWHDATLFGGLAVAGVFALAWKFIQKQTGEIDDG